MRRADDHGGGLDTDADDGRRQLAERLAFSSVGRNHMPALYVRLIHWFSVGFHDHLLVANAPRLAQRSTV